MKKLGFIAIAGLLTVISCQRNFDEVNPNALTIASFWQTGDDALRGVNAVYSTFYRTPALYSRWLYFHGTLKSDEGFGSSINGGRPKYSVRL